MSSALTCPECAARFAIDQRYCTECGHRVRPLPHSVASTLAAMAGARRIGADRLSSTTAEAGGATSSTGGPRLMLFGQPLELPSPRVMAVAVMALLAFGVIVGTGSFSLASSPLLVTVNEPAHSAAAPAATPTAPSSPLALSSPAASSAPATSGGSANSSPAASPPATSSGSNTTGSGSSSATNSTTTSASATTTNGLPPIKHVWVIELGDQGYANTFDTTSSDTYLNKTLASQGEVVPNVYASATSDLANEIGLVSGQGPTVQTENDCPTYNAVTPGTIGTDEQVSGDGCVYPTGTATFMSELSTAGDSYKAYVQGQGITPTTSCIHPDLSATDNDFALRSPTGYVTWRNPLVYFTDVESGSCSYEDTGLAKLKSDLSSSATTPNVSFIFPNPCDDGSDAPCVPGAPGGTAESDTFLQSVVPEIMNSAAYKADGMILITFAQAPQTGADADHSSCCDQPAQFPNLPSADYEPSGTTTTGTTTGTTTTGTSTTGTGTSTTGTETTTGTDTTGTSPATITATTTTGTLTGITIPGVSATVGTTTMPAGLITGTDTTTTATDATGTSTDATGTSTTVCPTTTTGTTTDTTTTASSTTTTGTGTATTGTGTTASDACCTTGTTTTTTATTTTTTGTDTTTTGTDTTGTTTTGTSTTGTTATGTACSTTSGTKSSPTGGGGQVGMLVLSKYVTPNDPDTIDYFNTFSITASLEELFSLKYTGYADTTGLPLFSSFLYSAYNSG